MATTPRANQIKNTPAGNIAATNVQTALNELDTEKASIASPAFTGNPTAPTPAAGDNDTSIATTSFVMNSSPKLIQVALSDQTSIVTSSTQVVTFRMPFAMTVTAVRASLKTEQSSGSLFTVDINTNGTSILSTKLSIDNGEKTSVTAATQPVFSTTSLTDDTEITIDIDLAGSGGVGPMVSIIGY